MKKFGIALAIIASLAVTGCSGFGLRPNLVRTEYKVIKPPETLYNCPVFKFPDTETLMDAQVAQIIVDMWENNQVCRNNMDGIREFLDRSERELAKK